jgi:hypothetical protein
MESAYDKARKIVAHCVAALREYGLTLSQDIAPRKLFDKLPAPLELSHYDIFPFDVDSEYEAPKAPAVSTPKGKGKREAVGCASKGGKRTKV